MRQTGRLARPARAPRVGSIVAVVLCFFAMTGCSSTRGLNAQQRAEAQVLVVGRASVASIELSDVDRDCVVDTMTPGDLDGLRSERVAPIADAVVSCVGDQLIGASVLRSQTGEISAASLDCAVDELDRSFLVDLVAQAMSGTRSQVRADIEVVRVLSVCLELSELLNATNG